MIELSEKFKPLIKEKSRYNIITGGRGSSKSFSVSVYLLLKTFEENQVILFSRYTMTSAYISVIPEFLEKIEMLDLLEFFDINKTEIVNKSTESKIIFKGLKTGSKLQTANLKSIAGLTIWVLDEAEELNDELLFDDIARSVRKKGIENKIILIFNPPTKSHWTYKRFFVDKGIEPGSNITNDNITYIHTTYLDNKENISKDYVDEANELKLTNPNKWQRVFGGSYRDKAEGVVFKNWELGEFPIDKHIEYGLDFGFSQDPSALIAVHIDRDLKKVYCKELLYQTGLTPSDLANIIKEMKLGRNLIIADNARPDIIEEIKRKLINIKGGSKVKLAERIQLMKDYQFIIDPYSKNLIEELNNYAWDKNYDDRPIDDFNHLIDALAYIFTYRIKVKRVKKFNIR